MCPWIRSISGHPRLFSGRLPAALCGLLWAAAQIALAVSTAPATTNHYSDDFSTTQFMDPASTTARWDTAAGQISLPPFVLSLSGGFNTSGDAWDAVLFGDRVFVADAGGGVQVIDVTNPASPQLAGAYQTPTFALGLAVSGNFLYVACGTAGLLVLDISDPDNPVLAGSYVTPGGARDLAVAGRYAYVAAAASGLRIIDITIPSAPIEVGALPSNGLSNDVIVSGDFAYLADGSAGLRLIDISEPGAPVEAGSYPGAVFAQGVAVENGFAYLANGTDGLAVIDVSNPVSPVLVGSYDTPGFAEDVDISGPFAYVSDNENGLVVIDISDPSHPALMNSYNPDGWVHGVWIEDVFAFTAAGAEGLMVVSIGEPLSPAAVGSADTPGNAARLVVSGKYAYVADGLSGLQVMDVSEPGAPVPAGSHNTPGSAVDVALSGDVAYVADGSGGLRVVDVSDPADPELLGSLSLPGGALAVALTGDFACLAGGSAGLQVVDVSMPAAPALVGTYDTPGTATDVVVSGLLAYVVDDLSPAGLRVIDISNPADPVLIGDFTLADGGRAVFLAGDYAYIALGDSGLMVLDIGDPTQPFFAGFLRAPGGLWDITVSGDRAFAANGSQGLLVLNVTNPVSPVSAAGLDTPGLADGVALAGEFLFAADGPTGLQVIQVSNRAFEVDQNVAASLQINPAGDEVVRVRFQPAVGDSVQWEVSAAGGVGWESVAGDGLWHRLNAIGTDLRWRAALIYTGAGSNPVCSSLDVDWQTSFARIDSIRDEPGDRGGWVRMTFSRSGYDDALEPQYPITGYYLYRRIDGLAERLAIRKKAETIRWQDDRPGSSESFQSFATASGEAPPVPPAAAFPAASNCRLVRVDDRYFVLSAFRPEAAAGTFPPGTWEIVGSVPALQQDQYVCLAPSLADSGVVWTWTVYVVSAHTPTPSVWFVSPPDSGYSIDNSIDITPPAMPQGFEVYYESGAGNHLSWRSNLEPDFLYYRVYRDTVEDFTIRPENQVWQTFDSTWLDPVPKGWEYYYQLTALDIARNESEPASSGQVTGTVASGPPAAYALYPNAPNPFNPATSIRYDVPAGGGPVALRIYDALGRRVRTLVDGRQPAGRRTAVWDGRDERGRPAAAGVYFYRLAAPNYVKTYKMILAK